MTTLLMLLVDLLLLTIAAIASVAAIRLRVTRNHSRREREARLVLDAAKDEAAELRKRAKLDVRTKRERAEGRAATCAYVEPHRRDTAVRFVIDALNGKVETILARVKTTNDGTLEQQIRDAFALVNQNGRAFRDARITPEISRHASRVTLCASPT